METGVLQLGDWEICLYFFADNASQILSALSTRVGPFLVNKPCTPKKVLAIFSDAYLQTSIKELSVQVGQQGPVWQTFLRELKLVYAHQQSSDADSAGKLFRYAWRRGSNSSASLGLLEDDTEFYALVFPAARPGIHSKVITFSLFLASQWYAARGGVLVHSSAVMQRSRGWLFLGVSEAGKSTVAQLSDSIGYPALGDDLNFIVHEQGLYTLAAVPSLSNKEPLRNYSLLRPPLQAVFTLVQDTRDYLRRLSEADTAIALFNAYKQAPTKGNDRSSTQINSTAFRNVSDVARAVPGYELHFRKSPDFWAVIDAEFSGGV